MKKMALFACCILISNFLNAEDPKFSANEWGTFTTLHWHTNGSQIAWYQSHPLGLKVSDLPNFVHQTFQSAKAFGDKRARMETPVIYFYTDQPIEVSVKVHYPAGLLTETYPGNIFSWNSVTLIPPSDDDLANQLPIDSERPDNHYYEARAVPEAAYVKAKINSEKQPTEEVEKFLFYRGLGEFSNNLYPSLDSNQQLKITSNSEFTVEHIWVVKTTDNEVHWQKLAPIAARKSGKPAKPITLSLSTLPQPTNSKEALEQSMVDALHQSGLTLDEAKAMVNTWEKQWYLEPGQRLFSILDRRLIDKTLPLTITPAPTKLERVFVHRQEIIDPNMALTVEQAMSPGTAHSQTKTVIDQAQLGRFERGVIRAIANDVGNRTKDNYIKQATEALAQ